jgi:hypothetical protein
VQTAARCHKATRRITTPSGLAFRAGGRPAQPAPRQGDDPHLLRHTTRADTRLERERLGQSNCTSEVSISAEAGRDPG